METLSAKVNSPEDQMKIASRTSHENTLLNMDRKIANLRDQAAKYGDVNEYNPHLSEMFALQRLREALVNCHERLEGKTEKAVAVPASRNADDPVPEGLKVFLYSLVGFGLFVSGFAIHYLF